MPCWWFCQTYVSGCDPERDHPRKSWLSLTVHDRPAAGCTPDINEANYAEYSSYFIAALSGIDRLGQTIDRESTVMEMEKFCLKSVCLRHSHGRHHRFPHQDIHFLG